jgi:hypothetical protein
MAANGFIGADGGSPIVDCPSACRAPEGVTVYAVPAQGNQFAGRSVAGTTVSTQDAITITPSLGEPLTATFETQ